jgi:hypothetical protein
MLKRIRQYFFDRTAKKIARVSHYHSWDDIRTILVLFESDLQEKNAEMRAFVKALQTEGKKVVACCYVDKKKAETATLDHWVVLDRSQVNWLKRTKEEFIQPLKTQFDVVMDMTETNCLPLKYVLLQSKSDFRCGKSSSDNSLYDFVIEMPSHPIDAKTGMPRMDYNFVGKLGEQIVRYLKMIK